MNYAEMGTYLMVVIGVLVGFVNLITELAKAVHDFKSTKNLNIFVVLISITLTTITFAAIWQIFAMKFTWYVVVSFIIAGCFVAGAAMLGFDKVWKYFEKVNG